MTQSESNAQGSKKKPVKSPLSFFSLKSFFKRLYQDPYGTIDQLDLKFAGFQFNIMRDDRKLLKAMIGPFLIAPFVLWYLTFIIMVYTSPYNGFDAGINQLSYPLTSLIMGEGLEKAVSHFYLEYGKGAHWTAVFIYYGFFVVLSKHLRKMGLVNSINVGFTTCFTALTIGIFELYWKGSFAIFQGQPWVLGFTNPQTMNTIMNIVFFLLGILRLGNINWKVVKPNFNRWTWILLSGSIITAVLWWSYGLYFPVQQIQVETDVGLWTSTLLFPQTLYTVALSPQSSTFVNSIAIWIENDMLHLLNTITKVFFTLACLNIFLLRERSHE